MLLFSAVIFAGLLLILAGGFWQLHPRHRCRHRFGLPMRGQVRCMRCTRSFRIETDVHGEWKIAQAPTLDEAISYPPPAIRLFREEPQQKKR